MIACCPFCRTIPSWNNAALTSYREQAPRFILAGCDHLGDLLNYAVVKPDEQAPIEAKIIAHWESLFAQYTSGSKWTEATRSAFRARIWPPGSGNEWENEEWVKTTRERMKQLPSVPAQPFRHNVKAPDDCPWDDK
jgi:hypothetical protein